MDYHLLIKFGDAVLPVNESVLKELTIIQDMDKLLPIFRLRIVDNTGVLTHIIPFDRSMSKVYIEFSQQPTDKELNSFAFSVYRRQPEGDQSNPSTIYDIEGLLDVDNLFSPDSSRGFAGPVGETIQAVAGELKISETDISPSLGLPKNVVQPYWSNIKLLNYLRDNLVGSNGECGFRCFIKVLSGSRILVFRSLTELVADSVVYKFSVADRQYQDRFPIYSHYIYDNYKLFGVFAAKKQGFSYFDYDAGTFTIGSEDVGDYPSLTEFFLIDGNDAADFSIIDDTGRSNDFTADFGGRIKGSYNNRLMNLVNMWIVTQGITNVCPGDVVEVLFPQGAQADQLSAYQYSGFWIVKRVVHNLGNAFLTKLLLTRNGLDTDRGTTLVRAIGRKRK